MQNTTKVSHQRRWPIRPTRRRRLTGGESTARLGGARRYTRGNQAPSSRQAQGRPQAGAQTARHHGQNCARSSSFSTCSSRRDVVFILVVGRQSIHQTNECE